jgi:hypothetical protein
MHRIQPFACALLSVSLLALAEHARAQQPAPQPAPKPQSSAGSWTPPAPARSAPPRPAPPPRGPAPVQPEQAGPPDQGEPPDDGPPGYYTEPWYGPPSSAGQSGYYSQPGYAPQPGYGPPPGYYAPPGYGPPGYGPPPYVPMGPDPATVHRHDGFYLRMSIGAGYMHDSARYDTISLPVTNASSDVKYGGGAVAFDILVGGTPAAGLVFGGGIVGAVAPNPKAKERDVSYPSDVDLNLVMIAGFFDWYPNPRQGFHLQGLAGIAAVSTTDSNGNATTDRTPAGIGLGIGIGHEWWIGNQWSIGVLGRLLYAHASVTENHGVGTYDYTEKHSVVAPSVLFAATYH